MRRIQIEMLDGNKMLFNLYDEYAPITVANFIHLIKINYFDGLIFHRVIKDFMSQAGGYYIRGTELKEINSLYSIPGEFANNGFKENIISHTEGVISMARTNDFNSASGQFFICSKNATFLDGNYASFGIVANQESLDVARNINEVETIKLNDSFTDFPNTDINKITIKTITLVE